MVISGVKSVNIPVTHKLIKSLIMLLGTSD